MLGQLQGFPVVFIPGNGGSYRQVSTHCRLLVVYVSTVRQVSLGCCRHCSSLQHYMYASLHVITTAMFHAPHLGQFPSSVIRKFELTALSINTPLVLRVVCQVRSLASTTAHMQYGLRQQLDWFALDFRGELAALDATLLTTQTSFAIRAVRRILDLYAIITPKDLPVPKASTLPNPPPPAMPPYPMLIALQATQTLKALHPISTLSYHTLSRRHP